MTSKNVLEIVFDKPRFIVSNHAIDRWCSKRVFDIYPENHAENAIIERIQKGEVILSINKHLYIRNNLYLFPCVKISHQLYIVKTVLTWSMVEERMNKVMKHLKSAPL